MKRTGGVRSSALPKALLIERESEPLFNFADRLGAYMYGTGWLTSTRDALGRPSDPRAAAGTDAECATMVRDQILEALRKGVLVAQIHPVVVAFAAARRSWSFEEFDELSDEDARYEMDRISEDDPLLDEDASAKLRTFTIKPGYWVTSDIRINWLASTISLPMDYLFDETVEARRDRPLSLDFQVTEQIADVPISIRNPDSAIRQIFRYEDPPTEKWLKRYQQYRAQGRLEALAAAWRYLAVNGKRNELSASSLAHEMQKYIESQGLAEVTPKGSGTKRKSGFQEMATHILEQFASDDLKRSVLVSSNFRNRRPSDRK